MLLHNGRLFGVLVFSISSVVVLQVLPPGASGHNIRDAKDAVRVLHKIRANFRHAESLVTERRRLLGDDAMQDFGKRGLSPKPLFNQIIEQYGAPQRPHRQRYADIGSQQQRRLETGTLTEANTRPIRFHVNYETLYEAGVQANPILKDRYCFRAGDWYRIGHPKSAKPSGLKARGRDYCNRADVGLAIVHENQWCRCLEGDVISPEMIDVVRDAVDSAVDDVGKYLSVRPVEGNLTFTRSEGSYPGMWIKTNQEGSYCDADCVKGSHVVTPDFLCQAGVNADAVLSLVLPPPIPRIGGTGGACSSDQNGRPVHLVFNWHNPRLNDPYFSSLSRSKQIQHVRGLILHEILHGLGFGTGGLWRNAYDSSGNRRKVIEQLEVTDADGTQDAVYHFVKGTRTYEAAKLYFGCTDEDAWQGLPLMGWPPFGRDSHHETRIMRDDVMSYGDGEAVSAITLATFEDTGHYLGNYSNADCIHWGKGRGCPFVTSRCEIRPSVETVTGASATQCDRTWSTPFSSFNKKSLEKCAAGCAGSSRIEQNIPTCDVECFTGPASEFNSSAAVTCKAKPAGDVEASGPEGWVEDAYDDIQDHDDTMESLTNLAWILLIPLNIGFWGCCLKCGIGGVGSSSCQYLSDKIGDSCSLPAGSIRRSKGVFYFLTGLVVLLGLTIVGCTGYVLYSYEAWEAYVGMQTLEVAMAAGILILLIALFGIRAVYKERRCQMVIYLLIDLTLLLVFAAAVALAAKFSTDVDGLSRNSLTAAGRGGIWEDKGIAFEFETEIYKKMESFTCRTYQLCCEPTPIFDLRAANGASRQCTTQHEGAVENEAFVLSDPSHPKFCPFISGVDEAYSTAEGVCDLIQAVSDFKIEQCQQDYCSLGLEGYENFIVIIVDLFRENMRIVCFVVGVMICFLIIQLLSLLHIWRQTKPEVESAEPKMEPVLPIVQI